MCIRDSSNGLDESDITAFFDGACEVRSWDNAHALDRAAFVRRGLSSSNAPMEGDPRFEECVEALGELFDRFSEVREEGGGARRVLTIPLRTVVHAGRL